MNVKRLAIAAAALAAGAGAIATFAPQAGAKTGAGAILKAADGTTIGKVTFDHASGHTDVKVVIELAHEGVAANSFHGFHVHAVGLCEVGTAASNHFSSAGPHYNPGAGLHANHAGDMPSIFVKGDGTTTTKFTLDRFAAGELSGKAVVLHARPDYWDTNTTNGAAGDRVACGVIR